MKLRFAGVAQALHPLLALRTRAPFCARAFIAANVEQAGGKEGCHLVNDIAQEVEHSFLARTHHRFFYAPDDARRGSFPFAREFGQCGNGGQFVSRHFEFGHDFHRVLSGIGHDFAHLFLGVVAAMACTVGFCAPRSDGSELGILLDFDAPALVVGQVPVQAVDFVGRKEVYLALYLLHTQKMAAGVEHHTAISKARCILDVHRRHFPPRNARRSAFSFDRGRKQLEESLHAIKETRCIAGLQLDAASIHAEHIAFGRQRRGRKAQQNSGFPGFPSCGVKRKTCSTVDFLSQILCRSRGDGRLHPYGRVA